MAYPNTSNDELEELRRLAEAATPGPWTLDGPHSVWKLQDGEDDVYIAEPELKADAAFVAACSPDRILALLAALDSADPRTRAIGEAS